MALLLSLLPPDPVRSPMYAALFLYGDTATGKTAVVRALCNQLAVTHAYVNCVETYAPKLVFEHILNQVSGERVGDLGD